MLNSEPGRRRLSAGSGRCRCRPAPARRRCSRSAESGTPSRAGTLEQGQWSFQAVERDAAVLDIGDSLPRRRGLRGPGCVASSTPARQAVFSASSRRCRRRARTAGRRTPRRPPRLRAQLVVRQRAGGEHDNADTRLPAEPERGASRTASWKRPRPPLDAARGAPRGQVRTARRTRARAPRPRGGPAARNADDFDAAEASPGERAPARAGRWFRRRAMRHAGVFHTGMIS